MARLAWRVAVGTDPAAVCALTFDRRAADELQERADTALAELEHGYITDEGLAAAIRRDGLRVRATGVVRGLVKAPSVKRILDRGLAYTNFHTTGLLTA